MIRGALLLILVVALSCHRGRMEKPEQFDSKEFVLKDLYRDTPFARVLIYVPAELDTLLVWVDDSDCPCCEQKKYRFTNAKGCLFQESGFMYRDQCLDSIRRLTIVHQCAGRDKIQLDTAFLNRFIFIN
jgi:hypothetical protein